MVQANDSIVHQMKHTHWEAEGWAEQTPTSFENPRFSKPLQKLFSPTINYQPFVKLAYSVY